MARDQTTKKLIMPAPYWGDLPAPAKVSARSIARGSSDNYNSRAPQPSSLDTATAVAPQPTPHWASTQNNNTESQTEPVLSPYASPTASSFQSRGLEYMPPSLPYGQSQYPPEMMEKRRRRASKNREEDYAYAIAGAAPPPAAPDVPGSPPVSFRHPYGNGGLPYTYQKEAPQQPDFPPLSPGVVDPDYYQPLGADQPKRSETVASQSSSRRVTSDSAAAPTRSISSRGPGNGNRKASLPIEEDGRLFADARSPLQKLELTLDSITKEEKRARLAAAEQRARERSTQGSTDLTQQHAVRFNDKATITDPEPSPLQVLPDPLPAQPVTKPQRASVAQDTAQQRTTQRGTSSTPKTSVSKLAHEAGGPQRNLSFRERAARNEIKLLDGGEPDDSPATQPATSPTSGYSVSRNGSNKLQKESSGDPWYQQRVEAEKNHVQISTRQQRGASHPSNAAPVMAAASVTTGPTPPSKPAGGSVRSKAPPLNIAVEDRGPPGRYGTPADDLDSPSTAGLGVNVPRHKSVSIAGQDLTPTSIRSAPGSRYNAARSEAVSEGAIARTAAAAGTAAVLTKGQQHDGNDSDRDDTSDNEHHFREFFHRQEYKPGHGMYNPPRFLDEWRKGTVGTLSGTMLELNDETTPSMDKRSQTWGDTPPSQRQGSISSRPRKAEAFDGEYDETNGMYIPVDSTDIVHGGIEGSQGTSQSRAVHYNEVFHVPVVS